MDGIMILNTISTPVYSFGWNGWCWLLIPLALLAIYLIVFGHENRRFASARRWRTIGIVSLAAILGLGTAICSMENVAYEKTYQVLVDSSVDMEQFRANYEILEQVGITYIIRQK